MNSTQTFTILIAASAISLLSFLYYLRYSRQLEVENKDLKTENTNLKSENRELRIISLATIPEIENRLRLLQAA